MLKRTKEEKTIPRLEDISAEYRRLTARRNELSARLVELENESRSVHRQIAEDQGRDAHRDRISSLIDGATYVPPASVREKMSSIAQERRDLNDAIHEITNLITVEHDKASREACSQFAAEHREMAAEFFDHIAAAAVIHAAYGKLRLSLERTGINAASLNDFGRELFGQPGDRNDDVGYFLRDGVRRGYLAKMPVEFA
jgi:uncharacterized coiled-coil DUF342 family protein